VERKNISSGAKWEPLVGYSRVVRAGNLVYVAGTVASDEAGNVVGIGDPYAQARYVLEKIEHYLHTAGAEMHHVVRTRMFVTDASQWEAITKAHHEFFKDILPVATLVEVSALIGSEYLVEIEVDAVIHDA
jgi:enamine deaminase RidA (YjgF/YER057c/UK114 family)